MLRSLADAQSRVAGVKVTAVLLNEGRLAAELRTCVHEVIVLPESSLNPIQLLARLVTVLRRVEPAVLHTHRIKEDILAGLANCLASRGRCVRTVHGVDEGAAGRSRLRGKLLDSIHAMCTGMLFDATFVVSAELCALLRKRFPGRRIVFVPNGVRVPETGSPLPQRGRQPRQRVHAGIVGRLAPIKRVDVFLRAAAWLQEAHPDMFYFSIYGEGPERERLEALTQELGLRDVVDFAGFKANMAAELAELDLLLLTSDSEGLPMVVLEAMAAGVPIIARAVGQIPDVLEGGLCGSLVVEQRPEAYAHVGAQFLGDRVPFAQRAARARERVRDHFSSEACARAYLTHYRELLGGRCVANA